MGSNSAAVARRYSKALWMSAENKTVAQEWLPALEAFVASIDLSKDLQALLKSPAISMEKKWGVVEEILKLVKSPTAITNFVRFLLMQGRIGAISEIAEAFKDQVLIANKAVEAVVESALPLTENQSRILIEKLEKASGQKVTLITNTNPELLAGLRVRIMGRTLDATLTSNLESMQQALLQAEA